MSVGIVNASGMTIEDLRTPRLPARLSSRQDRLRYRRFQTFRRVKAVTRLMPGDGFCYFVQLVKESENVFAFSVPGPIELRRYAAALHGQNQMGSVEDERVRVVVQGEEIVFL